MSTTRTVALARSGLMDADDGRVAHDKAPTPQAFLNGCLESALGLLAPTEKYALRSVSWYDGITEYWCFPGCQDSAQGPARHCAGQSKVISVCMLKTVR